MSSRDRFSIKASDIAVPKDDPFENDLFDSREKTEAIARGGGGKVESQEVV